MDALARCTVRLNLLHRKHDKNLLIRRLFYFFTWFPMLIKVLKKISSKSSLYLNSLCKKGNHGIHGIKDVFSRWLNYWRFNYSENNRNSGHLIGCAVIFSLNFAHFVCQFFTTKVRFSINEACNMSNIFFPDNWNLNFSLNRIPFYDFLHKI